MGSFFMHVLTLLHRNMEKCQISYGNIEIEKWMLGQARHIFKLGNVFYIIYYLKVIQQNLNYHYYEHFEEEPHKSDWYIYPAILPVTDVR